MSETKSETEVILPKPKMEGYVIYNPHNQLFSTGGCVPQWKKHGKIWSGIGPLKNHLNLFIYTQYRNKKIVINYVVYKDCEIFNIFTNRKADLSISEYMLESVQKMKKRNKYYSSYEIEIKND